MRPVLEHLNARAKAYADLPLFLFVRDETIPPEKRLAFVPCAAHFVMTFADIYALVLRDEPALDKYQELVNAHTYEDGEHWRWFLSDLDKLGQDPSLRLSDALRFVWGDGTRNVRMLSYHMCRLGLGASSLRKLVLVSCIEATGKVSLVHVSKVGREFARQTGRKLVYVGSHHLETESEHTLEQDEAHRFLADIRLDPAQRAELLTVVDEAFDCFAAFSDDLLRFARAHPGGWAASVRTSHPVPT